METRTELKRDQRQEIEQLKEEMKKCNRNTNFACVAAAAVSISLLLCTYFNHQRVEMIQEENLVLLEAHGQLLEANARLLEVLELYLEEQQDNLGREERYWTRKLEL